MKWIKFNESDKSTYPPINETVLVSYNADSYSSPADYIGLACLRPNYGTNTENLHWFIDGSADGPVGASVLENAVEPYGQLSQPRIFVIYWAPAEPYNA